MNKSIIFFVFAALFVVAFAEDEENGDIDHEYMVRYTKLLRENGYIPKLTEKDLEQASVLQLIDVAIKALEIAKIKKPEAAKAKQASIEFLEEAREKWEQDEPSHPLEPSEDEPTVTSKPEEPKKNFIVKGFDKLMEWLGKICP